MTRGDGGWELGDPERWPLDSPPSERGARHAARPARTRGLHLLLLAALAPALAASAAGVLLLWPRHPLPAVGGDLAGPAQQLDATVTAASPRPCSGADAIGGQAKATPEPACTQVMARLTSGPQRGLSVYLELTRDADSPVLAAGDRVVLGDTPANPAAQRYQFLDYQRRTPLLVLAGVFAAVLLLFGRLKGVRALLGLAVTMAVVVAFVLPAILDGADPVLVVLAGGAAAAVVAMYLTLGVHLRTTVALLGTLASLALVGVLAWAFVGAARFSGLASDDAALLRLGGAELNLKGLLLAGIVLGTLGVLDDVTVTQASAVWQLRLANPGWGVRRLYRSAASVGRDHIASTVNTLVLAYTGASLPLLLFLRQAGQPLARVLSGELVATELVRTLVGGIGLVASVPLTTLIAAAVATRAPSGQESDNGSHDLPEPA